jgi:protein-disulfide isomerase
MNSKLLFVATAALLAVAFTVAVLVEQGGRAPAPASDRPAAASSAQLVRAHAPTLGRAEAPVTLVEFLDPACETCALFYPEVKRMLAANPDKLRLVLRHVPFHPGSDEVVVMLESAKLQGRYWEALEALLRSQDRWVVNHRAKPEQALEVLAGVPALDVARVRADLQRPELRANAAQDLADAKALKVTKTPEYFVNGKPLPQFGLDELKAMVNGALRAAP